MNAHELSFVGQYWYAAEQEDRAAWQAQSLVAPTMLDDPNLAALYGIVSRRFSLGEPVGVSSVWPDLKEAALVDAAKLASDQSTHHQSLMYHAGKVFDAWRARRQVELLTVGLQEAEKSLEKPERAKKVAERLAIALLDTFASAPGEGKPQTRDELVDDQLARIDAEQERGITLPWPKFQHSCGPWMPGEVVGLTGFSGSGKSTFSANLAMQLARRGTPVIAFPMEMGEQWVTRAACALSRFPQQLAEKQLFRQASSEQRTHFRDWLEEMRSWPWEVVNRTSVSLPEVLAATRTLRRQWGDRTVVVIIDHMHRLDYAGEDADKLAGPATRTIKNFAKDDRAGLIFVCLYQPKKPDNDLVLYQPIYASKIRGHSSTWNELDVHLSIYRAWGERSLFGKTEWGDEAVARKADGSPTVAKPFASDAVLNNEFVFLKPDKRRVGGEGPSFCLNFDKPSGQVYEYAIQRESLYG